MYSLLFIREKIEFSSSWCHPLHTRKSRHVVICLMPHVLFLVDVCTNIVDKLLHACRLYTILVFLWNACTRLSKSPDTGNQREFRVEKFTVEKKKHLVPKTMSVAKLLKRLKNRR